MTTSAETRCWLASLTLVAGAAAAQGAVADDAAPPEMALLEYLGSWEGSDEDWLLLQTEPDEEAASRDDDKDKPVADEERSEETEHEK